MHYELWDTETGNLVGDYERESYALAVVREALRLHGPAAVDTLALGLEHDEAGDDDALPPVLTGAALRARVQALDQSDGMRAPA